MVIWQYGRARHFLFHHIDVLNDVDWRSACPRSYICLTAITNRNNLKRLRSEAAAREAKESKRKKPKTVQICAIVLMVLA
jgi:hypothetical protein